MSKEKQIEEMAKAMCGNGMLNGNCASDDEPCNLECVYGCCAEKLYAKGYRKQSEGEWIAHEDDWCGTYYTCSVCKCDWTTFDGTPYENNMRYCPECGAKMRKEDEGK